MEIDVKTVININLSDNQVRDAIRQYIGNKSDLSEYDLNRLSFVYTVTTVSYTHLTLPTIYSV